MKIFRFKRKDKALDDEFYLEDQQIITNEQSSLIKTTSPDDLSISLRAEMLPSSEIAPDLRKFRLSGFRPIRILALLGLLILVGVGWFFYVGPGRSILEQLLSGIAQESQAKKSVTPTMVKLTEAVLLPTYTVQTNSTSTRTLIPSPSSTTTVIPDTPTIEVSLTSTSVCLDVLTITLEDLGKTICVRGVIENYETRPSGFIIAFSNQPGSMYWVSYDLVWEIAKEGLCVEVTGEVMQIANSPVIVFGYTNLPQLCNNP